MKKIVSRIGRATAVGAIVAGMGLGLAAAPAQAVAATSAAPMTVNMSIAYYGQGFYKINVDAVAWMTPAEAQKYKSTGHKFVLTLWGEDPASDDIRWGPHAPLDQFVVRSPGIQLHTYLYQRGKVLNEDSGWYEGAGDELYMTVRLVDPKGKTIRSARSNTVHGKY